MVWNELTEGLAEALRTVGLYTPERLRRLELAIPREAGHGDWTTNLALVLAKEVGRPPRALAEALAAAFPTNGGPIAGIEVAGPGFLNFRYGREFLEALPARIRTADEGFGRSNLGTGQSVLVEYVSANPTGPLNVVSARAAAVGASLVRLLEATGHPAQGEFYVNDAGNQVDLLGASVAARFAESIGADRPFPADGYRGAYVSEMARELPLREARAALERDDLGWFRGQALDRVLAEQRKDLEAYGGVFSRWFRESEIHGSRAVERTLEELEERGMTYRARRPETVSEGRAPSWEEAGAPLEEATFLRTSRFGDDQDRVVLKSDGSPTYLLPDIAYHRDKRARGFRHAIDLWGPDHHGYVPRMKAALQALGLEPDFLEVLIVQQVNLLSQGQPVKMSKRAGEFVTLRDLMEDVGADCAKFFFLLRSTGSHLDFDLDLARRQNEENPAYYVQYAHARIASLLRFAAERSLDPGSSGAGVSEEIQARFPASEEQALLRKLAAFPEVVRGAAVAREPHRMPAYLIETAAEFHRFYHACRVVTDDRPRSRARLELVDATRIVLRNGLALMGVSAPDRLSRDEEPA